MRNVKVGQTVTFDYWNRETKLYSKRTVQVAKVDDTALEGVTAERDNQYRRYLFKMMENLQVVPTSDTKRVRFDDAETALLASLSGEQLAELYLEYVAVEGDEAKFDPQTGEVVVTLPKPTNRFIVPTEASAFPAFSIINKRGETLGIFLYSDNTVGIQTEECDLTDVSPETLRDEIVKLLD